MGRGKKLSSLEIEKINFYVSQKLSNREIAKKIGRSPKVINNYMKNKENYGQLYKGRTKFATTPRERRLILRAASNSTKTARQIASEINTTASIATVRRIIRSASHLKRKKLKLKTPLRANHIMARMSFAKKYMSWTTQWQKVIYTDEKKFNLDGPDGFSYYFHDLRKETKLLSRHHSAVGSVMVWGAISYYGAVDIVIMKGKQNAQKYLELIKEEIPKICNITAGRKWILQHDNAPIHTSRDVISWLNDNNIEVLDWPSCSPDLNIIENVWGWLTRKIYSNGRQFNSSEELFQAIQTSWNNISTKYIRSLYDSIPNRIFEVIRSNGRSTKY